MARTLSSSEKTLAVLEAYSRSGQSASLAQIAKTTGLDKSTVQRCAATLADLGYLQYDENRQLRPSSRCLDLAHNFLRSHPLLPIAYPILLRLREESGERTNLSLFEGTELIYAVRLINRRAFDFQSALVGRRMPAYSTAGGRAMLSKLPHEEARRLIEASSLRYRTSKTKTSLTEIDKQIRIARGLGYSVVVGEVIEQEIALAAAVVDMRGRPIAAIHIASSSSFWTVDSYCSRYAPLLLQAAADMSAQC